MVPASYMKTEAVAFLIKESAPAPPDVYVFVALSERAGCWLQISLDLARILLRTHGEQMIRATTLDTGGALRLHLG